MAQNLQTVARRWSDTMAKKITVESCKDCYLKEYRGGSSEPGIVFCTNKMTYGRQIDNVESIPEWCELEEEH